MNKEEKFNFIKGIMQGVNMDRTQVVFVLESGNNVSYTNYEPKAE